MSPLRARRWIGLAAALLLAATGIGSVAAQQPVAPRLAATPSESGYLGLIGDDRITGGRGVQVLSVRGRGAAEAAGLRTGDVVVAINRQPVNTVVQMAQQLVGLPVGGKIEIEFERSGKRYAVPVTLGPRPVAEGVVPPANLPAPAPVIPDNPPVAIGKPTLGVRVISPLEGARRGYAVFVRQGALVEHIEPGSPADRYGLALGAVIVAIDGKRIDDAVDLAQAVAAVRPGDVTEVAYFRGDQLFRKQMRLTAVAAAPAEFPADPGEIRPKVTEFPSGGEPVRPRVPPPPPPRPPRGPEAPATAPSAEPAPGALKVPFDPLLPPPVPTEPPAKPEGARVPLDPLLPPPAPAPVAPPVAEPAEPNVAAKPPIASEPLPPSVVELDRKLTEPPAKSKDLARLKAELAETVRRITALQKEQQVLLESLEGLQKGIEELEKGEK